jgi:hypothetical protein
MERRDYLMDQIEKIAQLIAALMGSKKVDQEAVDQALTDLTGFNPTFFAELNFEALAGILKTVDDDNKKALIAQLLLLKDSRNYEHIAHELMSSISPKSLSLKVKAAVNPRS